MSPTPLWEVTPKGCLELNMSESLARTPPRDNGIGLSQLGSRALHIALDACWSRPCSRACGQAGVVVSLLAIALAICRA